MATALYPGGFKPPHRGHFEVVQKLLNNTHGGKIYDKDTAQDVAAQAMSGESDKVESIDKVVVFVGAVSRNGITKDISTAIWKTYAKYLGNVVIESQAANPMQAASSYAKERPEEKFYAVTGIRDEDDAADLKRITSFKNRENVQGLVFAAPGGTRATDLRQAVLSGSLDRVRDFFPKQLSRDELSKTINMLKQSIISEIMSSKVDELFDEWFINENQVKEQVSTTPTQHSATLKSKDRAYLVTLYNRILSQIGTDGVDVRFNQDHISVSISPEEPTGKYNYTPYIGSLLEYMIDEGMNIQPLPEVKIKRSLEESANFFGRTAYYDPNINEIVLYAEGRHPKDVVRSFSHEMVHHIQNIEGRLGNIQTSNTNESDALLF